jgi:hypothetical protein
VAGHKSPHPQAHEFHRYSPPLGSSISAMVGSPRALETCSRPTLIPWTELPSQTPRRIPGAQGTRLVKGPERHFKWMPRPYSMSVRNFCPKPAKPNAPEWPYTRFDWAAAVILTLPREAGSARRSVGDCDHVPATIGRLQSVLSTPDRFPVWLHMRFDRVYFAGGGVTLKMSNRIFQSSPSRT